MYPDIPVWLAVVLCTAGFCLLAWSADLFVDGAAALARALGINPFIVGMVIIGFGTSAPELCVSALSGAAGHSNLSLGNAYGSCVFNIAAILGAAALIHPIRVKKGIGVAVVLLIAMTLLSCLLVGLGDGFSRRDGVVQLVAFAVLFGLYCWWKQKNGGPMMEDSKEEGELSLGKAVAKLVIGLVVLAGSSHILVWGAVDLARALGVSELMIGLTVVGIGTSLPELASAIASARKGQNEFVLGNIVGSNMFNTLAVVGLAGTISPFTDISPWIMRRDLPAILLLTLSLAAFGVNWRDRKEDGVIRRWQGVIWLLAYAVYLGITLKLET